MKKTKLFLTTIVLLATTWLVKGQTCPSNSCNVVSCEYVCNGGFDSYSSLPTAISSSTNQEISKVCGWTNGNSNYTPDYYHSAVTTNTSVDIPCNLNGVENYQFDDGYVGLLCDILNWYESIQTTLKTPLTTGDLYEFTFYLSLGDMSSGNIDHIFGIRFPMSGATYTINPSSASVITGNTGTYGYTITPSSIVGVTGWTKYTLVFGAEDDETSFKIGFLTSAYSTDYVAASHTTYTNCVTSGSSNYSAYYYLDNVSIRQVLPITATASHTSGCTGESFTLTASGVNTYTWTSPTTSTTTNPYIVNPSSSTIYTVTGTSSAGCVTAPATITITPSACCTNTASGNITLRNVNLVATGGILWASLASGGFYTGNINAPVGGIITNTLTIIGSFSISTPVTFYQSHIGIDKDVSIKQYSTTIIDHSFLYGPCGLWEGILSYGSLDVTNSWIEDGYTAVQAGYNLSITSHPRLYVDNVLFNKNYVGIAVGTTSMDPGNLSVTGCIFSSRNFSPINYTTTTRYTSLFPNINGVPKLIKASSTHSITNNTIRTHTAIAVIALTSNTTDPRFKIGKVAPTGSTSLNADYTNRYDYLDVGIYNERTQLDIYNNKFTNMINAGGGTVKGAVYHNDKGYHTTSTKVGAVGAGNYPTVHYKNIFGSVSTGIILDAVAAENGGALDVSYNDFATISRYGVSVKTWNATSATTETILVSNNSFSTTSYVFYAYNNTTIKAEIESNTLVQTANTYTSTGYGAYINEVNKPATTSYSIHGNNFSGGLNGIYVINTQYTRVVNNTVQVKKPSGSTVNAPVWMDNDDNCFIKGNTVSCSPTNSGDWHTLGILNNASLYNTVKCNNMTAVGACLKIGGNCNPTYIYFNSFNNTGGTDPCLFGIWMDNGGESGDIGRNSGGWQMSDDIWGDFSVADTKCQISSNHTSHAPWKIYYDGSNSISKPLSLYQPQVNINTYVASLDYSQSFTPTTNSTPNSDGCTESERYNMSTGAGKTIDGKAGSNEETEFRGKKRILIKKSDVNGREIAGNENSFYEVDSLITVYTQTKNNGALSSAKSINTSVSPVNNVEQNQKDFNSIYCTYLENVNSVSENQVQDLKDLALLCPFTDGLAVYNARGLIRNWDDSTRYYNPCENTEPDLINDAARFAANKVTKEMIPTVYPNPSNGKLIVENSPENSTFEVYDVVGRKVFSNTLNGNATQLDVSSFNNGTYLFKIIKDGKTIKQDKLMITK